MVIERPAAGADDDRDGFCDVVGGGGGHGSERERGRGAMDAGVSAC